MRVLRYIQSRPLGVQIGALVALVLTLMALGVFYPSTEMGLGFLVALAVVNRRVRIFALDYAPFILLLFTYDTLRNFADDLTTADINVTNLIQWEKTLFGGTLPSYWLQRHLMHGTLTPLLDALTNTLYLSHFMTPLLAAIALWRRRKSDYWAYAIGLVALSYAGFATFILFPAAPPWWATAHGFLPDQPVTLAPFVASQELVASGPNPVAAMPSLHTAYPTYIALVAFAVWGRRGLPVLLLPLCVAFSTVYLGHHYVVDALAGAGYAVVAFSTAFLWFRAHPVGVKKRLAIGKAASPPGSLSN